MASTIRALTLRQPWAFAILHLGKSVENRSWKPPRSVIGKRIAIHAGLTLDQPGDNKLRTWLRAWEELDLLGKLHAADMYPGCIIGTVLVTGWARAIPNPLNDTALPALEYRQAGPTDRRYARSLVYNRWAEAGSYQWGLANPEPVEHPVRCRGAQGIWTIPPELDGTLQKG